MERYSKPTAMPQYVKLAEEKAGVHRPAPSPPCPEHAEAIISAAGDRCWGHSTGLWLLAKNAGFAERVGRSGFQFIGPSPESIPHHGRQSLGQTGHDSRRCALHLPGSEGDCPDDPVVIRPHCQRPFGYPVIVKAAGGGGGRGMRVVHTEAALVNAVQMTKAEARRRASATLPVYMEKFLQTRAMYRDSG